MWLPLHIAGLFTAMQQLAHCWARWYFSKTSQDSREGKDSWNKASNERRRTKYAAKRAIPNSPMANSISSFSFFQAQRPENSMAAVKWLVKRKSWSRPQACFQGPRLSIRPTGSSVFVFVRDVTHVQTCAKKCFVFRSFGSYLKHVQTCDDVRVQSATQSTASVHT